MADYRFRTALTGIEVSEDQRSLLRETIEEWKRGCQIAADVGWERGSIERSSLQPVAYETIRERTSLSSQHTLLAIRQASDALVGVAERRERNLPASKPEFTSPTITYDARTMTLFDDGTISLTTTEDRVSCPLRLPHEEGGYQWGFIRSPEWRLAESNLTYRNGTFRFHLRFRTVPGEKEWAGPERVLGIDLGIENIAVTSTAYFASGRALVHRHEQFEHVRGDLQRAETESAHRTILQRGSREERHTRDLLHRVSKDLIGEADSCGCRYMSFEDLRYIRNRGSYGKFHRWAHRRLVQFVQYKAEERGIEVVFVNPQNTSLRCSDCGFTSEENRRTRNAFKCERCGKSSNADYNAAKNIGWRFVRRGQQPSRRTGHRQLALKSGTVTPNRGFSPYPPEGSEAEDTDKSQPNRPTDGDSVPMDN